ncbi:MAG: hypothetical protein KGH63_01510 [Candidatus Micrarchaeota archaeon]|nr:hypothetical protein [Candidatus Micrarchaeota archaeon]
MSMAYSSERYSILGSEITSISQDGDELLIKLKKPQYHIEYQDYLTLMKDPNRKAEAQKVAQDVREGKISVV